MGDLRSVAARGAAEPIAREGEHTASAGAASRPTGKGGARGTAWKGGSAASRSPLVSFYAGPSRPRVAVEGSTQPCWASFFSCAAARTQRENGVPLSPSTCSPLIVLQACVALSFSSRAALAIAVMHWLNGSLSSPAMCRRLWSCSRRRRPSPSPADSPWVPFHGAAHLTYLPRERIIGLSKLGRRSIVAGHPAVYAEQCRGIALMGVNRTSPVGVRRQ